MASVRDYFDTDIRGVASVQEIKKAQDQQRGLELEVIARTYLDFNARVKYVSFLIVTTNDPLEASLALIENPEWALNIADGLRIQPQLLEAEHQPHSRDLPFSRRVFIYSEHPFEVSQVQRLKDRAQELQIDVGLRDANYAKQRAVAERALAFVSHDSRDKDLVARPLANELARRLVPVWFDEYSLRPGTSLRASIDQGIKDCSKCVLIVSRSFLSNKGWTLAEFDSIFARELVEKTNYIIPVWVDVDSKSVFEYCPRLADRVSIQWSLGLAEVAKRLSVEILSESSNVQAYRKYQPIIGPRKE